MTRVGHLSLVFAAGLVLSLALYASTGTAAAPSVAIVTANTAMTATTNFSTAHATASCPSGSTLVGGGDELTRGGSPVPNDGAVTLGLVPSDSSGTPVAGGTTTPSNWTTWAGYSGMAPGLDTVNTYGMCLSSSAAATVIASATTSANTLGPVTAVCPGGSSLVGGGGGYTSFPNSNNTKVFDSFPSDAAGDVPSNGATGVNAWTFQGNSNNATAETTTAIAFCATDVSVSTQVAAAAQTAAPVTGGSTLAATVSCPGGTTLLGGGSVITDDPSGPGTGGQGVHIIGTFPSDGSGNPVTSSAGSWTVIAEDGGQNLNSLGTEAFALCASAPSVGGGTTSGATGSTSTPTPTTTTTAPTPAGSTTPTGSAPPAQPEAVTLHSGKAGSLTVGSGSEAVTVSWPKGEPDATLTAVTASPLVPKSHGVAATSAAVQLLVLKGEDTVTHFALPFDLDFPGAPGNVTPAFTLDGNHWTAIPHLGSSSLLPGLTDGYYRDSQGALHILTRHATIFGLLKSSVGLNAAREPAGFGFQVRAGSKNLLLRVQATRAGSLAIALTGAGHIVASWRRKVPASLQLLKLSLPRTLHGSGANQLHLTLAAGGAHVAHSARIHLVSST
jgi:hypothetical protein